jgi:hypothetical protein
LAVAQLVLTFKGTMAIEIIANIALGMQVEVELEQILVLAFVKT